MVEKRKMSLVPPQVKDDRKLKEFIEEPEKKVQSVEPDPAPSPEVKTDPPLPKKKVSKTSSYPWQAPGVTPEIIKPFVLRLKQPDKLKAEYIVKNSLEYNSLQDFYLKAIFKQIDKDLKRLKVK
jgi:hypothetical protein